MRLLVQHRSSYVYPQPAALGPHLVRLRPANHTRARIESYRLAIAGEHKLHWQQDPHGNHVARVTFQIGHKTPAFELLVELAVDIKPVNPFDVLVDPRCKILPWAYPDGLAGELAPFRTLDDPAFALGPRFKAFVEALPRTGDVIDAVVAINNRVASEVRYVIREETGVWTPEETLTEGRGSCRDSAVLLVAALRSRGLAARFVSGYLIQLADEGMIPDQPKGVSKDVVDLHAWAEDFRPGAGWIGLDATAGLLTGEGHLPLCATASPALAAPVEGTSDIAADQAEFGTSILRLGHEPRPTAPYTDEVWTALLDAGDRADAALENAKLTLTSGGEPTFTSRDESDLPEWNSEALGDSKWRLGHALAAALRDRLAPGAVVLERMGKHYPGEPIPRWSLDIIGRRDGGTVWRARPLATTATADGARQLGLAIARELGLPSAIVPAYEDPIHVLHGEASLPVDVDPRRAALDDPDERRRLVRVLDRGATTPVAFVLPLARSTSNTWLTETWSFRRENMYLVPGDSPAGLRLPLASLGPGLPPPPSLDTTLDPTRPYDPRTGLVDVSEDVDVDVDVDLDLDDPDRDPEPPRSADPTVRARWVLRAARRQLRIDASDPARARVLAESPQALTIAPAPPPAPLPANPLPWSPGIRTALVVEPRNGALYVFLPPVFRFSDWLELAAAIDRARAATGLDARLEGYPPPPSPAQLRFAVTPDPGVLEVNLPPTARGRDHAALLETVFEAALASGLQSEKYLLDGRLAGSGGGHHITLGGPTPFASPFLSRPDVLASLITFAQHHPSLSYLFTGLFVGPTSQAPRVDEARHDSLYELELALDRAFSSLSTPAWLVDGLFRHLLCDVAGSTHRTELSIDKLYDPQTPYGRQGLVELRAFEMPPHPRLAAAQVLLARSLIAAFAQAPYRGALVRWGQGLHDRFLLPWFLQRDLDDVLAFLADRGLGAPADAYRPFADLRCPLVGTVEAGDVRLEVRNAIEPWHVLGEEVGQGGTARYVDSSLERIEVRATGLVAERHRVLVNGAVLPMRPTSLADTTVAGVRFRAWCPPHSLQPHLGVHHPLRFDVVDTWAARSMGAGTYHVWHPEGFGYTKPPLTRFEASARRSARFTHDGQTPYPVQARETRPSADQPYTLDLRRLDLDRALPRQEDWPDETGARR